MQIITNYNDILAKGTGMFYFPSKALATAFVNEYFSSNDEERKAYCFGIDHYNDIAIRLKDGSVFGYSEIDFYLSPVGIGAYPNYEKYEVNYTNKTSNFSEGDFVRIREDLHRTTYYGGIFANDGMEKIRGSAGIIDSIISDESLHQRGYRLKGNRWWWNEEMFENVIVINGVGIPVNENLVLY